MENCQVIPCSTEADHSPPPSAEAKNA